MDRPTERCDDLPQRTARPRQCDSAELLAPPLVRSELGATLSGLLVLSVISSMVPLSALGFLFVLLLGSVAGALEPPQAKLPSATHNAARLKADRVI